MNDINDRQRARQRVAELLPRALEAALASYEKFLNEDPENSKDLKEHHAALKICASHIAYLLKMMPPEKPDDQNPELETALAEAEKEIQSHEPLRY